MHIQASSSVEKKAKANKSKKGIYLIDSDNLIIEVQKRPSHYDIEDPEYCDQVKTMNLLSTIGAALLSLDDSCGQEKTVFADLPLEFGMTVSREIPVYRIGQLYMIAKHSHEQSQKDEGVIVIKNEPCDHEKYGSGQFTEKRVYLNSRLPRWISAMVPNIFYITEKAWNFYPYTITEYTCSFLPRFIVHIETKYADDNGVSENITELDEDDIAQREVIHLDIVFDEIPPHQYKESEDCTKFKSTKTNRGPLGEGWKETSRPIMCSYKVVRVKFEVWGAQTRVEAFTHKAIRDILLVGHRQAFAWIDEWFDMSIEDIRNYEKDMHIKTNQKVRTSTSQ